MICPKEERWAREEPQGTTIRESLSDSEDAVSVILFKLGSSVMYRECPWDFYTFTQDSSDVDVEYNINAFYGTHCCVKIDYVP